jgi:hypothetical protein|nr:MAG TPA: hypothetical protein [Caudoviricetes sp.]
MKTKITIIDYDEAKLYDLSACVLKMTDWENCFLYRSTWESLQNSDLQLVGDLRFNGMPSRIVQGETTKLYIYGKYIRFLDFDDISEGDYVRIKKYNDVTSHFKIKETTWNKFYSRPLLVKYISPSGNCDLEYNYEGDKITFYFNRESIRYLCTSEEVNIFQKMFGGSKTTSEETKIDKELTKISAIIDTIEDGEKSYINIDSVLSKNPSDKNTKLTLFFNYILRYNNTENIDDFLKRLEKV